MDGVHVKDRIGIHFYINSQGQCHYPNLYPNPYFSARCLLLHELMWINVPLKYSFTGSLKPHLVVMLKTLSRLSVRRLIAPVMRIETPRPLET